MRGFPFLKQFSLFFLLVSQVLIFSCTPSLSSVFSNSSLSHRHPKPLHSLRNSCEGGIESSLHRLRSVSSSLTGCTILQVCSPFRAPLSEEKRDRGNRATCPSSLCSRREDDRVSISGRNPARTITFSVLRGPFFCGFLSSLFTSGGLDSTALCSVSPNSSCLGSTTRSRCLFLSSSSVSLPFPPLNVASSQLISVASRGADFTFAGPPGALPPQRKLPVTHGGSRVTAAQFCPRKKAFIGDLLTSTFLSGSRLHSHSSAASQPFSLSCSSSAVPGPSSQSLSPLSSFLFRGGRIISTPPLASRICAPFFDSLSPPPSSLSFALFNSPPPVPSSSSLLASPSSSSIELLKQLRSLTGISVSACKEALTASKGDLRGAVDWLRERGAAASAAAAAAAAQTATRKGASHLSPEGLIAVASWKGKERNKGVGTASYSEDGKEDAWEGRVMIRVGCGTDFVARNRRVTAFARQAAAILADCIRFHYTQSDGDSCSSPPAWDSSPDNAEPPLLLQGGGADRREPFPQGGADLVARLLKAPWRCSANGEDADDGDCSVREESGTAEKRKDSSDMLTLALAMDRAPSGDIVRMTPESEEEGLSRKAEEGCHGSSSGHGPKRLRHRTVEEELHHVRTLVGERVTIEDAAAVSVRRSEGAVGVYLHDRLAEGVGTLGVLVKLGVTSPDRRKQGKEEEGDRRARTAASGDTNVRGPENEKRGRQEGNQERNDTVKKEGKDAAETQEAAAEQTRKKNYQDLDSMAEKIGMQVAAAKPLAVDEGSLDPDLYERERLACKAQAEASGKPPNVAEKMAAGRLKKWLKEVVLIQQ
ncbi:elongation factor ts, partial [Cystoisospora suis]